MSTVKDPRSYRERRRNLLEIKDLTVRLDGTAVLDRVTLDMPAGTFLAVIGPNGGGKTTLLKVLLGFIIPDNGSVKIFGLSPEKARRSLSGKTGYLPQNPIFDRHFPVSAMDVVVMGLYGRAGRGRKIGPRERARAWECLELTGMSDHASHPVGALSGGQQQRVFIARALVTAPELLLLDEPTSDIDPAAREQFYALLGLLMKKLDLSIVLVSHDLVFVPRYCDMVACLNRKLHSHGRPGEVLHGDTIRKTYGCEVNLFLHGKFPHWVADEHDR